MRKIALLLFNLVFASPLFAQKDFYSFIPKNYDTLYQGVAKGDLNKDGIQDAALALYPSWENDSDWIDKAGNDSLPQRMMIILFGSGDGYREVIRSFNSIMCKDCGGAMGDPFAGISIKGNVLEIDHYGGSNLRWSYSHKFRYQNGEFCLIGETTSSFLAIGFCDKLNDSPGSEYEDINFLTGQYERKRISEDCKLLVNKKGKKKIQPLISLANFEIDN
jgi:hypothetical protein